MIEAASPRALQAALEQMAGGIAGPIGRLRERLLDLLAHVEAGLDFVDESDVDEIGRLALARELAEASEEVRRLGRSLSSRDRPEARPRVVLVGPPNAGKSRLFNALLGRNAAIVSPIAGTTRDYLSGPCECDGMIVDLIDTAGIEDGRSEIEASAQRLRQWKLDEADLALVCSDSSDGPAIGVSTRILRVLTKSDLAPTLEAEEGVIATSAETGDGLGVLRSRIADALREAPGDPSAVLGTAARCRDALERAGDALQSASSAVTLGGDELVAIDVRRALDDLGRVVGAVVTEDVLDRIFRRFCVGK